MLGEERQHAQNQCGTGLALESPVKSQATVHAGGPRAPPATVHAGGPRAPPAGQRSRGKQDFSTADGRHSAAVLKSCFQKTCFLVLLQGEIGKRYHFVKRGFRLSAYFNGVFWTLKTSRLSKDILGKLAEPPEKPRGPGLGFGV